jgi:hypothetical protein
LDLAGPNDEADSDESDSEDESGDDEGTTLHYDKSPPSCSTLMAYSVVELGEIDLEEMEEEGVSGEEEDDVDGEGDEEVRTVV